MSERVPALGLPYQLRDFRRAPGLLKTDYEDFVVEEVPLYEPAGEGPHTYVWLEKAGLGTPQAISDLARALGVKRQAIGFAGLKDSRGVTRQWLSIEHVPPEQITALSIPRLNVLQVTSHRNKLKLGHLRGNRFRIRVRDTEADRLAEFQDALATLSSRGVPNYFGPQRFGDRGDNPEIGRLVLAGKLPEALDLVLGKPSAADRGSVRHARELYEAGHYGEAVRHWPGMYRDERTALKTLVRTKGKRRRAFLAIDRGTRNFYVSAFQSHLFNQVVARRLETGVDTLLAGDLAWVHRNGAVFHVEDPTAEQPRAAAFEISPTGPLFGYRMTEPTGQPAAYEQAVLTDEGLTAAAFETEKLRVRGGRRPLRFRPEDGRIRLGADRRGAYLEVEFMLPRGCYATTLLRELFSEVSLGAAGEGGTEAPPHDDATSRRGPRR